MSSGVNEIFTKRACAAETGGKSRHSTDAPGVAYGRPGDLRDTRTMTQAAIEHERAGGHRRMADPARHRHCRGAGPVRHERPGLLPEGRRCSSRARCVHTMTMVEIVALDRLRDPGGDDRGSVLHPQEERAKALPARFSSVSCCSSWPPIGRRRSSSTRRCSTSTPESPSACWLPPAPSGSRISSTRSECGIPSCGRQTHPRMRAAASGLATSAALADPACGHRLRADERETVTPASG